MESHSVRKDSMASFVAGFGLGETVSTRLDRSALAELYRTNWLARNVVDMYAEDCTAKGVQWLCDPQKAEVLEREFRRFRIWPALTDALRWARLYGGALLCLDFEDMLPDLPAPLFGKLTSVRVFDRYEAKACTHKLLTGVDAGKPAYYDVSPAIYAQTFKLDASRAIRFEGAKLPADKAKEEELWGDSTLSAMKSSIDRYSAAMDSSVELLKRCYLRFLGVRDFWQMMQDDGDATHMAKLAQNINAVQNISGLTIADASDVFQSQQYGFGGLTDVLNFFAQDNSGAADVPLVRLFGMSPSGFSTGEADLKNYYGNIARAQEDKLRAPISLLASIILRMNNLDDSDLDFTFVPLAQPTESERAAAGAQAVSTILSVYQSGLITAERALEEIRRQKDVSGLFASVTDEDVARNRDIAVPEPEPLESTSTAPADGADDALSSFLAGGV